MLFCLRTHALTCFLFHTGPLRAGGEAPNVSVSTLEGQARTLYDAAPATDRPLLVIGSSYS